jgi:nicotinamidase-related amidase
MTTLTGRPRTALLVIDVQVGVVATAVRRDDVIANISTLVEKARAEQVPVVWIQHSDDDLAHGSDEWRYVPELTRRDDEALVQKNYGDSFEATDLEAVLAERGVGRLVVTGVSDAHTTEDLSSYGAPAPEQVIAHTNLYWQFHSAPGRTAGTVETEKVDFGG